MNSSGGGVGAGGGGQYGRLEETQIATNY